MLRVEVRKRGREKKFEIEWLKYCSHHIIYLIHPQSNHKTLSSLQLHGCREIKFKEKHIQSLSLRTFLTSEQNEKIHIRIRAICMLVIVSINYRTE